jgi:hypothetical protein
MSINYDILAEKSFFTEKNFSAKFSPSTLSRNMISCNEMEKFHFYTCFFLTFISSLYIELKQKEKDFNYNINRFTDLINNLNIKIQNDNSLSYFTRIVDNTFHINIYFILHNNFFQRNNDNLYDRSDPNYKYNHYDNNIISKSKPYFGINNNTNTIKNFYDYVGNFQFKEFNKSNINNQNINGKFKQILTDIFLEKPENLMGYLLHQKIYYNIIINNIDIQNYIRKKLINNTTTQTINNIPLQGILKDPINTRLIIPQIVEQIKTKIDDNIENINKIKSYSFDSNDYLIEKAKYKNKINEFNNLRNDFANTLDKLNLSIKLYNTELANYNKIKNYATYITIILILIMVFTIILSIFPIFKNDTKNAIYIITFIILLIITYIYYINFKYVNLYERFYSFTDSANSKALITSCALLVTYNSSDNDNVQNMAFVLNSLLSKINEYTNTITDLLNDLRVNIVTIGNKSFSQDANIIVYNVYLEKKRQLEINNIKLTNLFNMIEILKKQTNYLFNFVFVISCLCLILLLGLVLYSSVPQLYIFIIILCVILITILMIYFAFAFIQPTRMLSNKNYWAITNPSKNTMGKL